MKILTALISAACLFASAPAEAQQPRHGVPAVDCGKSMLSINATLTCMAARGVLNDNRTGNKEFYLGGTLGNTNVFMQLSMPPFTSSIRSYSEQDSLAILKNLNDVTRRQGRDWSSIKTDGNSSYLTFKTERENCIAFDHAGPLKEAGYAWVLRGYICAPAGTALAFDLVKKYLAATRVGNTRDNLNAYGQPVRPLQGQS